MLSTQYMRAERKAGGVNSTEKAFLKACWSMLAPSAKLHEKRESRHKWLRSMLADKKEAKNIYNMFT